ncbi:MAG: CopD family protein [Chloroflexi bacterium]|nr:CopD family protein [Chloroflexota bacterium]
MAYQAAVFIHLLAAMTWIGGTLFLVMVMVPLSRGVIEPPALGIRILTQAARRFRTVAWASIVLLVITGAFMATDQWRITLDVFLSGESHFVKVLQMKVGLVALIIVLSAFHDFVLGPRIARALERARSGGEPSRRLMRGRLGLVWLARFNLLLVLAIVALAIVMTRGFPA